MNALVPAGEILPHSIVRQVFVATDNYLSGVSLLLATFARRNTCHVDLRLFRMMDGDSEGNDAAGERESADFRLERELRIDAGQLYDNSDFDFFFEPIEMSKGVTYILSVSSRDSCKGNAITVWTQEGYGFDMGLRSAFVNTDDRGLVRSTMLRAIPRYATPVERSRVPRGILLSPVTQCNYNCIHCISKETRSRFAVLSGDVCEELMRYVRSGDVQRLATDYSGDLFFADEKHGCWLDFVIRLDIPFHIDTNGSRLSQERIAKLVGSKVESINISVDAATPETFRRIRRGPTGLEQVLKNAEILVKALEAGNRQDVRVSLGFTLMRSNIHELIRLVEIASNLGIRIIQTRHLEAYENVLYAESMIHYRASYNLWRSHALTAGSHLGVTVNLPKSFCGMEDGKGHDYCREPWFSAVILGNGDVMACCVPGTKMGNLSEQSLEDIWNGPAYQMLRKTVNSADAPGICKSCPIYRLPHNRSSYLLADSARDNGQSAGWVLRR